MAKDMWFGFKVVVYNFSNNVWKFDNKSIEVYICEDGKLTITGYPNDKFLRDLKWNGKTNRDR